MEQIFHSTEIKKKLELELSNVSSSLKIITAFCKIEALEFIEKSLQNKYIDKKMLIRFRLNDIIGGATDIGVYKYCINNGWKVYFNLDLHSKIYIFNNSKVIVGSANLTSSGIGLKNDSNIESAVCIDINSAELSKIEKIFDNSIELSEGIYKSMMNQIKNISEESATRDYKWDNSILKLFNKKVHCLWVTEMFFSKSPSKINDHDRLLLEISENESSEDIKDKFRKSKPYLWLKTVIDKEIYFGELTAKLHYSLIDDPKPYRKDVKTLLVNLLSWTIELGIEDIIIDKPNFSQRIKVIS
ncbi:MAG: phospholipase D-like domain-containing protein [Bacillota bacterium]|nr:phospholipase D-like domain-containing protein [Bacillota bacterium]